MHGQAGHHGGGGGGRAGEHQPGGDLPRLGPQLLPRAQGHETEHRHVQVWSDSLLVFCAFIFYFPSLIINYKTAAAARCGTRRWTSTRTTRSGTAAPSATWTRPPSRPRSTRTIWLDLTKNIMLQGGGDVQERQ